MNKIVQMKTEAVEGPDGAATAMMINLDIEDAGGFDAFLAEVIDQFKVRRTLAPPETSMMLVSIFGEITADRFAQAWIAAAGEDPIVQAYVSLMTVADVIQIDESGEPLSSDSLLPEGHIPLTIPKKPWWKFW